MKWFAVGWKQAAHLVATFQREWVNCNAYQHVSVEGAAYHACKTKTGTKTPALTDRMFSAAPYLSAVPHEKKMHTDPCMCPAVLKVDMSLQSIQYFLTHEQCKQRWICESYRFIFQDLKMGVTCFLLCCFEGPFCLQTKQSHQNRKGSKLSHRNNKTFSL